MSYLFDDVQARPVWKYLRGRYSQTSSFSVFVDGTFQGIHLANVGINQGDVSSLWMFDFFVSDFGPAMMDCPGVSEVMQIHDDSYIVIDVNKTAIVEDILHKASQYWSRKGLQLNTNKAKFLCHRSDLIPVQFSSRTVSSAKVGGVDLCSSPAPPLQFLDTVRVWIDAILTLPHQFALLLFRQCIVARLKYCWNVLSPTILESCLPRFYELQSQFVSRLLQTSVGYVDPASLDQEQLVERVSCGGLALYRYTDLRKVLNVPRKSRALTSWFDDLPEMRKRALFSSRNPISLRPSTRSLRVEDFDFSAYLATLLDVVPPRQFYCQGALVNPSREIFVRHMFTCQHCCSNLRTVRHDMVNSALSTALHKCGIPYYKEPPSWPLRESRSGKEGPDGLLIIRNGSFWVDLTIHFHSETKFLTKAYSSKMRTYQQAADLGLQVQPLCFSIFSAVEPRSLSFLNRLPRSVLFNVRDHLSVMFARSLALFFRLALVRASKLQDSELPSLPSVASQLSAGILSQSDLLCD